MSDFTYTFTVFTPTYNRAHLIHGVYKSLLKQTFKDFEWIVVDDGSTDNTAEIVEEWIKQSPFPIRYFRQEHQHKKVAHNLAMRKAKGKFFLVFDSDDECIDSALERFLYYWEGIPPESQENFVGVTVHCMDEQGKIIGDLFPCEEYIDSTPGEMAFKYKVKGEKWGFQRTEVLRKYPFPENIPGYVPEGIVWLEIGKNYKTRYVNEAFRLYKTKHEGRIMKSQRNERIYGLYFVSNYILQTQTEYLKSNPLHFLKESTLWLYSGFMTGWIKWKDFKDKTLYVKFLIALALPVWIGLYLRNTIIDTYKEYYQSKKTSNTDKTKMKTKLDVR